MVIRDKSISTNVQDVIKRILTRYYDYERLIRYPGDWGERAFRFWLIKELFMDELSWHTEYIVFGERYDVLLLDEDIRPRIYVETKKPEIEIRDKDVEKAIRRAKDFYSIDYVVITNGTTWILYDCVKNVRIKIDNIRKADDERVAGFFNKIHAKNFIGLR